MEVELTGLCIVPGSVVVVVLRVDASRVSFTVVQADSKMSAAAARHGIISVFIGGVYLFELLLVLYTGK